MTMFPAPPTDRQGGSHSTAENFFNSLHADPHEKRRRQDDRRHEDRRHGRDEHRSDRRDDRRSDRRDDRRPDDHRSERRADDRSERRSDDRDRRHRRRDDDRDRGDRLDRYRNGGGEEDRRRRDDRKGDRYESGSTRRRSRSPRSSRQTSRPESRRSRSRSRQRSRRERSTSPVPLSMWPRKLNNWDVAPPGFEHLTVQQVKATGLFTLPYYALKGAPMSSGMTIMTPADNIMGVGMMGGGANTSRGARRVYAGNLPLGVSEQTIGDFFNYTLSSRGMLSQSGNPVVSVSINTEKNFAFVEFRTPEEATSAMALDGINFQNTQLKIRRPKDYVPPIGGVDAQSMFQLGGATTAEAGDDPNKLYVGGLPNYLTEDQVQELLKSFGELKSFKLPKDGAGLSKGYAFCEFEQPELTDIACQGLNGMDLGDKKLVVMRVKEAKEAGLVADDSVNPFKVIMTAESMDPTNVIQFMNMVVRDELLDDEEYEDIVEDIKEECNKYGRVVSIRIPRPEPEKSDGPGVGKVYVEFAGVTDATTCMQALSGRKFADRVVVSSFYPAEKYSAGEYL